MEMFELVHSQAEQVMKAVQNTIATAEPILVALEDDYYKASDQTHRVKDYLGKLCSVAHVFYQEHCVYDCRLRIAGEQSGASAEWAKRVDYTVDFFGTYHASLAQKALLYETVHDLVQKLEFAP